MKQGLAVGANRDGETMWLYRGSAPVFSKPRDPRLEAGMRFLPERHGTACLGGGESLWVTEFRLTQGIEIRTYMGQAKKLWVFK